MRLGKIKSVVLALGLSCGGVAAAGSALLGDLDPMKLTKINFINSISGGYTQVGEDNIPTMDIELYDKAGASCYSSYVNPTKTLIIDTKGCSSGGGVSKIIIKVDTEIKVPAVKLFDYDTITLNVQDIISSDQTPQMITLIVKADPIPDIDDGGVVKTLGAIVVDSSLTVIH